MAWSHGFDELRATELSESMTSSLSLVIFFPHIVVPWCIRFRAHDHFPNNLLYHFWYLLYDTSPLLVRFRSPHLHLLRSTSHIGWISVAVHRSLPAIDVRLMTRPSQVLFDADREALLIAHPSSHPIATGTSSR